MRNTSNLAVVYFMVVMLAGHYVLLNLFLAAIMKQMETLTLEDIESRKVRSSTLLLSSLPLTHPFKERARALNVKSPAAPAPPLPPPGFSRRSVCAD